MGLILIFFAEAQADIGHSITNGNLEFVFAFLKHIIFDIGKGIGTYFITSILFA